MCDLYNACVAIIQTHPDPPRSTQTYLDPLLRDADEAINARMQKEKHLLS